MDGAPGWNLPELLSQKLPRAFYDRETVTVATELLGNYLVHVVEGRPRVGRIVEVEAYLGPHDLAAHSSKGLTPRTRILFGPPGYAYVYLVYGLHWCLNAVTETEGHGSAVLLRALEPVLNVEAKTSGPGLLCRAMGIDGRQNGHDLQSDDLFVAAGPTPGPDEVVSRPRIGVDYSGPWAKELLRFHLKGNRYVSRR